MIPHGTPTARSSARGARFRQLECREREAGDGAERGRDRDLERCGRPEPRARGKVARNAAAKADGRPAELGQLRRDPGHVPAPPLDVSALVKPKRDRPGEAVGREPEDLLGAYGRDDEGAVDRDGKDEAAPVVRVLADQIDTAGSSEQPQAATGLHVRARALSGRPPDQSR